MRWSSDIGLTSVLDPANHRCKYRKMQCGSARQLERHNAYDDADSLFHREPRFFA